MYITTIHMITNQTPTPKYFLTKLPGIFYLISTRNKDRLLKQILGCLLADGLFSITQEPDGSCSMIMQLQNEEALNTILKTGESYLSADNYYGLQIDTSNPALNEAGMLAEVTSLLAEKGIPILCLSTFNYNYIYYPVAFEAQLVDAVSSTGENIFQFAQL